MDYSTINNKRIAIKCDNWLQSFKLLRQLKKNGCRWKNNDNIIFFTFWSKNTNCYNVINNKVMINNEMFFEFNGFEIIEFKKLTFKE